MLAILAMLARKGALRVAPGGSAPLFPFVVRRGPGGARSGRESRFADRTGKRVLRYCRLDKHVPLRVQGGRGGLRVPLWTTATCPRRRIYIGRQLTK